MDEVLLFYLTSSGNAVKDRAPKIVLQRESLPVLRNIWHGIVDGFLEYSGNPFSGNALMGSDVSRFLIRENFQDTPPG